MLNSKRSALTLCLLAIGVLAVFPRISSAQMAQHVPADAILYVDWRGADDLGAGYEQSHLKAFIDKSEFPKLIHQAIPAWMQRIADESGQAQQIEQMVAALGTPLWSHPTAFYVGGLDVTNKDHPVLHAALLCDAGADASNMAVTATNLAATAGQNGPVQIYVQAMGNLVVISTFAYPQNIDQPLANSDLFKSAMAQCGSDRITTAYINVQAFTAQIDSLIQQSNDNEAMTMWPKIRDAIGLNGIRRIAASDGFAGKDWVSDVFVDAPAPRVGLASLLDTTPLTDDDLKRIPATATMAAIGKIDLGKFVSLVRQAIENISPDAGTQVAGALRQANDVVGFDIQQDFINALGDEWTFYIDPQTTGAGSLGFALINKTKDADKFAGSMNKLQFLSNSLIHSQLQQNGAGFLSFEFRQETIDGLQVNFAALPLFTPSWAIKDGSFYGGLYPQIVVAAASRGNDDKSILDNPTYQDLRKRLGGSPTINGLTFIDVPQTAPLGYQNVLSITRLFLGAGDIFGLQSPAMCIPPLQQIMPELDADGSVSWVDDAGLHGRSITAFPGASLFVGDGGSMSTIIQMMSSFGTLAAQRNSTFIVTK